MTEQNQEPPKTNSGEEETKTTEDPTKAYSKLYNDYKADKEKWSETEEELRQQIADLNKKVQSKEDGGKDAEQLMTELNDVRSKFESAEQELKNYKDGINNLVEQRTEGLSEDQKKMLEFADSDPFKRLNFIDNLRTKKPVKTSQGGAVVDQGEVNLDIQHIANEANNGNMQPYKKACDDYGKERVNKWIAEKTSRSQTVVRSE